MLFLVTFCSWILNCPIYTSYYRIGPWYGVLFYLMFQWKIQCNIHFVRTCCLHLRQLCSLFVPFQVRTPHPTTMGHTIRLPWLLHHISSEWNHSHNTSWNCRSVYLTAYLSVSRSFLCMFIWFWCLCVCECRLDIAVLVTQLGVLRILYVLG